MTTTKLCQVLDLAERLLFLRIVHLKARGIDESIAIRGPLGIELGYNLETEFRNCVVHGRDNLLCTQAGSLQQLAKSSEVLCSSFQEKEEHHMLSLAISQKLPLVTGRFDDLGLAILERREDRGALSTSVGMLPRWSSQVTYIINHFAPTSCIGEIYNMWRKERLLWWKKLMNLSANIAEEKEDHSSHVMYRYPEGSVCLEKISMAKEDSQLSSMFGRKIARVNLTVDIENAITTILYDAYEERTGGSKSSVLHLHPRLSPIQLGIAVANEQSGSATGLAKRLKMELRIGGITSRIIPAESIESAALDLDAIGTPYSLFLDTETFKSGIVALRHRSTALLEYMHLAEVQPTLQNLLRRR